MSEQKPTSREEWRYYWKKREIRLPTFDTLVEKLSIDRARFDKQIEQLVGSVRRATDQLTLQVDQESDEAQAFQEVFGRPMQIRDRFSPTLIASPIPSLPNPPGPNPAESMNRWSQLEREFRELRDEYGEPLGACWTSGTWDDDGHQWFLSASNSRLTAEENESLCGRFGDVAQRAAVYAGHPLLATGLFFWLDLGRAKSPRYRGGVTSTTFIDGTTRKAEQGSIEELFLASAECCYKLGTEAAQMHREFGHEIRSQSSSSVSLGRGDTGITDASNGTDNASRKPERPRDVVGTHKAQAPKEGRKAKKLVRRNQKYEVIDKALREFAGARPKNHEEVFRLLDDRKVAIPNRRPFNAAGGWLKGFQQNRYTARAWLSQVWGRLGLPAFARGPKK